MRGPLCTAALVAALLLLPAASAHAVLTQAEPPVNGRVESAPTELVLQFSEPVEDRYTAVTVVDSDGARYDDGNEIDPDSRTAITVPLKPMPDGVYTVRWQTLSRDTHTVKGQYLLAVNVSFDAGSAPPPSSAYASGVPEEGLVAEVVVRSIGFVAMSLVAGLPLALIAVPAHGTLAPRRSGLLKIGAGAGFVAAAASLGLLYVIGQRIDTTLVDAATTESGRWVALRGAAALAAAGAALVAVQRPRDLVLGLASAFGAVALFATAMSGHAAAESSLRTAAIVVDWGHQIAVAFWVAGVALIAAYVIGRPDGHDLARAIRGFTPWAIGAVALIVATGTVMTLLRILSVSDLPATVYGRALALKLLLLVPLVVLGALHRLHGQRALDAAADTPGEADDVQHRGRLRASLLVELLIMVAVLVAAGTLASVAPPDSLPETTGGTGVDPTDVASIIATFEVEGWKGTVRALPQPLKLGPQNVTLTLERLSDDAPEVLEAYLVLRPPEQGPGGEGSSRQMTRADATTFYVSGFIMTESGTWHNDVIVQGGFFHEEHTPMYVQP